MLNIDQIPDAELTSRVQTMLRERGLSDVEAVMLTPPVLWLTRRVFAHTENITRSLGPNLTTEEITQAVDNYPDSLLTERFVAGLFRLFS